MNSEQIRKFEEKGNNSFGVIIKHCWRDLSSRTKRLNSNTFWQVDKLKKSSYPPAT